MDSQSKEASARSTFGRRKAVPSVCIADAKQHVRAFLGTALEELGFIVSECSDADELVAVLDSRPPDVAVIGLSAGGIEASDMVKTLATKQFGGLVLLIGPQGSRLITAIRELGEGLGLPMLPTLATPFCSDDLRSSVAAFLPIQAPSPPVDAGEAIRSGWLELWYQPKIHAHKLALNGAEALIRMRHPHWGIVEPAYFIPHDGDPHFQQLSEFVISQAIADWRNFVAELVPSTSRSIFQSLSCRIQLPWSIYINSFPITLPSTGSSSKSMAPRSSKIFPLSGISPSKPGFTRSRSRLTTSEPSGRRSLACRTSHSWNSKLIVNSFQAARMIVLRELCVARYVNSLTATVHAR